jgi:hydrophobe/amphiphile efflux-1 (HAE1) family protein
MTLSDLSIRNHVFAWMLMTALILFGAIGYARLGVSQNPDVDFPVLNVSVNLEGASPEVIETDVVEVLEDAVVSVEGVKSISSTSRQGRASVVVEFDLKRDIDLALQDVQTRVAQAARQLPRDIDPPVITKTNPEDQPIMWLNLSGNWPPQQLADYIRNVLKQRFQTLPGVGEVTLGGFLERNIRVWLDARKMESFSLTADDVVQAIQRQHIEVPAGRIESGDREMNVRAEGEAIDVREFSDIVVATRDGGPIRLSDIAVVEDGLEDRRRIARALGKPALGMGIKKQRGANAVEVAHLVKQRLEEVRATLPEGLALAVNFDGTSIVEEAIHEVQFSLLLAALLTGIVCWFFLGSWSSTVNILLAIPTSIIGTFLCMYFFGFTLNTFTVLGLSLSVGIVVDDAIMVLENIYRHREAGRARVEAALIGAREITFAAMAATAAIIAVFLPVAFMQGIIGRFFFEFGVTISVAVLLSLLEALTLTPMRCSQFLETGERTGRYGQKVERFFARLAQGYERWLHPALRHRGLVLAGAALLFVGSLVILNFMNRELVPSQDLSRFMMRLQTPVGSSVDYTDKMVRRVESFLMSRPELDRYYAVVGGFGGGGAGDVNQAMTFVTLKPRSQRPRDPQTGRRLSTQEFMNVAREELNAIPGLKAVMQDLSQQGFSAQRGFPVEVSIRGPNWDRLAEYAGTIMDRMRATGLVTDVDTDYLIGMPEVKVLPDRQRAADLGVSMASIGSTVNTLIGGVRVARFKDSGRRYDVRVRLEADQRQNPEDIRRLLLRTSSGSLVRLGDVVAIEERPTLQIVTHRDRQRAIGIFANLATGASQARVIKTIQSIANDVLPDGYSLVLSGSAQAFQESFQSLLFALVLGFAVAYMILASQFNSFSHPVVVLLALPFSISGALLALFAGGQSLNIYSMIGLVLLMGIAKKNSIILVDFTNQLRREGVDREAALLRACPTRLRPILMTSISTIAGAVPAALALGPGAETRIPMSLAVIGGMVVSTFMTLFVVPAGYSVMDDLVTRLVRRRAAAPGPGPAATPAPAVPVLHRADET